MKKITLLLALAVTMLSWTESSALASDFSDVPNTSPFISYIEDLKSLGVTDGTAPGQFGPNQLLTRAQFAKFIAVAFQLSDNKKTVPFTDIQNHWSSSYVRAAYQAGIIEGTSATTFSPDKPLKREEAAALVWRIAKKSGLTAITAPPFVEKPDAWAAEAVGNVVLHGWYSADVVHTANKWSYRPQDTMTRQEMAALLDLAMKAVPGSLAAVVTTPSATFLNENGNVVEFPQLSPWQAELKGHLENQETNFQITLDNPDEFKQIDGFVKGMFALEDYLHYVYNGMEYSYDGISKATFKVHFLETKEQSSYVTTHAKEIDASLIKQGMNDFEKEKAIHDYIISHVAYDQTLSDHTAYGALTKGTTVCQGYSLLAYRMLQEAGLPNKIAEGVAGGELHTWNVVQLNGNWYNLDTTWDDPVPDVKDRIEYTYFNLTDAQLRHDHSWTLQYPSAGTDFVQTLTLGMQKGGAEAITDQMLMNTTGLLIESSDFTADTTALASTILDRELSKGSTQIRFRFLSRIGSAAAVLKSALTNNMMQKYNINNGVTYSNQPDTRSVGYTVVDLKVK